MQTVHVKKYAEVFTEGIAEVVQGDDDFNAGAISTIKSFVNDTSILEEALGLGEGTETSNAYPAFLAQQSLDVTSFVGDSSQAETFSCDTKSAVITNYDEDDTIYFDKAVNNFSVSDTFNDFQVESSAENKLIIRDVRGKTMTFNTPNGTAYAYMAASSAEVDGKNSNGGNNFEILFGANDENSILRAGNAGSYLWGGVRGNDELFGGIEQDTFAYSYKGGNDTVQNAEGQDIIILNNISLSEITLAQINDSGVILQLSDGDSLNVNGTPSTFNLKVNDVTTTYRPDYQIKTWQEG